MQNPPPSLHLFGERHIRRVAWGLSGLGILPFIAGALSCRPDLVSSPSLFIIIAYGAVIVSFLSGTVGAHALMFVGNSRLSGWILGLSVIPGLSAWAALLIQDRKGIVVLIAAFCGLLGTEFALYRMEMMQRWWWLLRLRMTALVIGILMFVLL